MTDSEENPNLVWQGRLHIGDEPGLYGDAPYAGLCVELPVEFIPYSAQKGSSGEITLILSAEGIRPDRGYPGHRVTVSEYREDPDGDGQWGYGRALAEGRLDTESRGTLRFAIPGPIPRYAIVRIEVDGAVRPGLYLETVIHTLSVVSSSHYAYLGYRFHNAPS